MSTRNLLFSGLDLVKQQASAVASTVSLAKPYLPAKLTEMSTGDIVAGLGYVKNHTGAAIASIVSLAKPYLPAKMNTGDIVAGLGYVKPYSSGWTRSGPVRSRSEPSFGPAADGPDRTGPSSMAVLILGTGPAATKPGPDRADRPWSPQSMPPEHGHEGSALEEARLALEVSGGFGRTRGSI